MHIAYYAPAWPAASAPNGIVTYVSAMRDQLCDQGHDVSVIAQGKLYAADGRIHILERPSPPPTLWGRLRNRIERHRGNLPATARLLAHEIRHAHRLAGFDLLEMEESFGWSQQVQQALAVPVVTRLHGPQGLKPDRIGTPAQQRLLHQRVAA
jgi:Glycosyltransferase Family 4